MQIERKDSVPAAILAGKLAEDFERFAARRQLIDGAFRELAIHETTLIDIQVLDMLEAQIAQVKARRPDLSDTDAYIVAGRLLKQLVACYQGALSQLLP